MQIREANLNDKEKWNSFVNKEGGSFFHYFEWKIIYEGRNWRYIPLLLENNESQIICILPIVKINGFLYSKLVSLPDGASGGFIFKKNLTKTEQSQIIKIFLSYIKQNYSKDCSNFTLKENLSLKDALRTKPTKNIVDNGFIYKYDKIAKLPCTHILELKKSFEDDIWYRLWKSDVRNHIRKAKKKGAYLRQDKNFEYMDDFVNMLLSTYIRFGSPPPSKNEVIKRLTIFKNNTKVWIAFLNREPIASILCYYTPSTCYWSKMGYYDAARGNYVTNLLLYEAIKDACENNYKFFEFGATLTPSLASWKEQFMAIKVPMRVYEKRYSNMRFVFEKETHFIKWSWNNKRYILKNWRRSINRGIKHLKEHIITQESP